MRTILAFAAALAAATPIAAQDTAPITIGTTHLLQYDAGDTRQVNVYLPDGYARGERAYPVLYLIDGGLEQDFLHVAGTAALNALWGRSQPVIVVGIETRERRAELISSKGNAEERVEFPMAGKGIRFRNYIREKVKPLVEANYRTNGEDAVIGESLAGLHIVETWLWEPDLFDRYAAIDPSLWWEDVALARGAQEDVADGRMRGPLLMSYTNEGPSTTRGVMLVQEAGGDSVCVAARPDLTHATAYHVLTPQALQFLFPTGYDFEPEWGFELPCEMPQTTEESSG